MTTNHKRRIDATIDEYGLTVASPPPALRKMFQIRRHVGRTPRSGDGTIVAEVPEKLYIARQNNSITLPRGAWRLLEHVSRQMGYKLSVIGNREIRLPWQIDDVPSDDQVLGAPADTGGYMALHTYGMLTYSENSTLTDALVALVRRYPEQNIGIVTACVAHAARLREELNKHDIKAAETKSGATHGVVLGVAGSFRDPSWLDIAVAVNAGKQLGQCQDAVYRHGFRAKQLAMVDERVKLSPTQRRALFVRYGFQCERALRDGKIARRIFVDSFKVNRSPQEQSNTQGVELERALVWRNHARNRQIASWAKQAVQRRPAILAASLEHAAELSSFLPAWQILAGEQYHAERLLPRHAQSLRARLLREHTVPAIVAPAGLSSVNWADVDVLVRADAGIGLVSLPELALHPTERRVPLTMVDVDDSTMSPALAVRRRRRHAAYRDAECFPTGSDPVVFRMNVFIREQI